MTSIERYDVVIPIAKKDFSKLAISVAKLKRNLAPDGIYIVSPTPVEDSIVEELGDDVFYFLDEEVIPSQAAKIGPACECKSSWLWQQFFIKMFQDVTKNDWYVAVDADLFVMRPIPITEPVMFYSLSPDNVLKMYRNFNIGLIGSNYYPATVMTEIAVYNKKISSDIVEHVGGMDAFIERSTEICSRACWPSEMQLYLAWLHTTGDYTYSFLHIKQGWRGMYGGYEFSEKDVIDTVDKHASGFDIYTLHSWKFGDAAPKGSYIA